MRPLWRRTGNAYFPVAARVEAQWWVLRVNNFPDHPTWTLLVDGRRRFDVDDAPPSWHNPADQSVEALDTASAQEALALVVGLEAYGSDVGQPCDNPYCCG
jgi:hypothetical protein